MSPTDESDELRVSRCGADRIVTVLGTTERSRLVRTELRKRGVTYPQEHGDGYLCDIRTAADAERLWHRVGASRTRPYELVVADRLLLRDSEGCWVACSEPFSRDSVEAAHGELQSELNAAADNASDDPADLAAAIRAEARNLSAALFAGDIQAALSSAPLGAPLRVVLMNDASSAWRIELMLLAAGDSEYMLGERFSLGIEVPGLGHGSTSSRSAARRMALAVNDEGAPGERAEIADLMNEAGVSVTDDVPPTVPDLAALLAGEEPAVGPGVVHIASHQDRSTGGLKLSKRLAFDVRVLAHELARPRYNRPVPFAFLNACNTGEYVGGDRAVLDGRRDTSLGFAGVLRAAGIGTVVATATEIPRKKAATNVAKDFYRGWLDGLSAGEAMSLLLTHLDENPTAACFRLYGDPGCVLDAAMTGE